MTWFQPRSSRNAFRTTLSAVVAFAAVTWVATESRAEGPTAPNTGGFSADDETVGTLPSTGSDGELELLRDVAIQRHSLSLEGRLSTLQNALLSVRGVQSAAIESMAPGSDAVRLTLLGDVQVVLDRMYVDSGDVRIALVVPKSLAAKPGQLFLGREALPRFPLVAGPNALPIVEAIPVRFVSSPNGVSSAGATRTVAEIRAVGDLVTVTQVVTR